MEQALEMEFCYANPFMQQVFTQLMEHGKRLVITSDMYLSKSIFIGAAAKETAMEDMRNSMFPVKYEKEYTIRLSEDEEKVN